MQCADVDVHISALNAKRAPAVREISVDQRADIFIGPLALQPQLM